MIYFNLFLIVLFVNLTTIATAQIDCNPILKKHLNKLNNSLSEVKNERQLILKPLAEYIINNIKNKKNVRLLFICTHNSRRSHIAQIYANSAPIYYGIQGIRTFSGGTEATVFHKNAIEALRRMGFGSLQKEEEGNNPNNPKWFVESVKGALFNECFSKRYDDIANPRKDFVAIMVCSEADKNCPVITGAEKKISLPYNDPKEYDNTEIFAQKYDEKCIEIGREMMWLFNEVKRLKNT